VIWSRRFRASEANLDGLRARLADQSEAVVMLDSLRSITRSCGFGENDPEMGSLIDDLKHQITEAGGTVLLVHHCNKSNDTSGTEALSGHRAVHPVLVRRVRWFSGIPPARSSTPQTSGGYRSPGLGPPWNSTSRDGGAPARRCRLHGNHR
jgi:hypothetical protein